MQGFPYGSTEACFLALPQPRSMYKQLDQQHKGMGILKSSEGDQAEEGVE